MKKYMLLCLFALVFIFKSHSQDVYKKRYYIPETIKYNSQNYKEIKQGDTILYLKVKDNISDRSTDENKKVIIKPRVVSFKELNVPKNSSWISRVVIPKKGRLKANVIFEDQYIYINPWLTKDSLGHFIKRNNVYFFELQNRQSVKLYFRQWTLNALSVPLKIRFGEKKTEFSTGANLGVFFGYTWGKTNFVYRKKIGNKQYDSKFTTGLFLGADKLEFSFKDSNNEDQGVNTAFISIGTGALYSYQKFTLGITGGFDFGLGDNRDKWDFQGRPWIGATLGYSLFSF